MTDSEMGTRLPLMDAVRLSVSDMMARGPRSMLTLASIILSIAFFVTVLTNAVLTKIIIGQGTETQTYYLIVAALAVIVCGVSITNAMIMSATERFKEIGTLKCLGALDQHIVLIFLIEGFVLGILGGSVGSLVGLAAGSMASGVQFGLEKILLFQTTDMLYLLGSGIGLALVLTGVSSIYPVYFAAHLSPTEAFRYEI